MKALSVKEMQELDKIAIEEIGIPSLILMENAGRCVAEVAMDMLKGLSNKKVAIFCGRGNNGGDGFVAARHLLNKGIDIEVFLIGKIKDLKDDPKINASILKNLGVEIKEITAPVEIDVSLIIDAIFGIGLKGEVTSPIKEIIDDINKKGLEVLSVDIPSGLDGDRGIALGTSIKATKTLTIQFPKKGFYINHGPEYTGEILIADIGLGFKR